MEKTNRKTSNEAGVSLIEVMVSLLILGAVLVALGQGLTLGIRMNTDTKSRVTNLGVCKRIIEQMKSDIQASQAAFDGAETNANFNKTFYVNIDKDGNETISTQKSAATFFEVTAKVSVYKDSSGNALRATYPDCAACALVKSLDVTVLTTTSALLPSNASPVGSSRETRLTVEIARPVL